MSDINQNINLKIILQTDMKKRYQQKKIQKTNNRLGVLA